MTEQEAKEISLERKVSTSEKDPSGRPEVEGKQPHLERKEAIKKKIHQLSKNPESLIMILVLLFSLGILLYYFSLTKNQTLWWDEAEYMDQAKYFAFGIDYDINAQRPFLFPLFAALLFKLGFGEIGIRLLLVILPAWLIVIVTYLFIKEAYDIQTAAITAIITSVSWIHIFYAMRLMTDAIGLFFGLMSFYFFWKGYIKKEGRKYIWLIGFFVSLSFLIRLTGILHGLVIFLFLLVTDKFRFLREKDMWISVGIALLTLTPLLIYDYVLFQDPLAFRSGYGGATTSANPLLLLNFIYDYPEKIFFLAFLIGLLTFIPMLMSLDLILKKGEKRYQSDLFMLLTIIIILLFFMYFVRAVENRWLITMSIGIFAISARGILSIFTLLKKYSQLIAILALISLVLGGMYFQLKHADEIIKIKLDSYRPIKDAALWIKENSNPQDIIATKSSTQTNYYAERSVINYGAINESEFEMLLKKKRPVFFEVSLFEAHPPWAIQQVGYADGSQGLLLPFTNSSLRIVQNQVVNFDLKQKVEKDDFVMVLVYPQNAINGVFVYRIEYKNNSQSIEKENSPKKS